MVLPENPGPEHVYLCAAFHVRKTARVVSRFYDKHLDRCGLRSTQFALLAALSQTEPATVTQLASLLGMDHSTLVRNVRLVADKGWLSSDKGRDKRTRELRLTPEGRQKLAEAIPHWREAQEKVLTVLGEDSWAHTVETLASLREVTEGQVELT